MIANLSKAEKEIDRSLCMNISYSPLRILVSPFCSARGLPAKLRVYPAALLVLGVGLFMAIATFISYLNHAYPPPPEVLKVYVSTWGEFVMLPFLKIPPESYRLFMAIISIPLVFTIWMLMSGTAKLLSLLLGGRASYEQYLVITAFSFFPFWILAAIIDTIFSGVINGYVLLALTGQLGPFATTFWTNFPKFFYTILYGLGGVWVGVNASGVEAFPWWKALLIAVFTFAWPMLLMTLLLR
jgi:hypothetical protein